MSESGHVWWMLCSYTAFAHVCRGVMYASVCLSVGVHCVCSVCVNAVAKTLECMLRAYMADSLAPTAVRCRATRDSKLHCACVRALETTAFVCSCVCTLGCCRRANHTCAREPHHRLDDVTSNWNMFWCQFLLFFFLSILYYYFAFSCVEGNSAHFVSISAIFRCLVAAVAVAALSVSHAVWRNCFLIINK